jgi:hypothetical protein
MEKLAWSELLHLKAFGIDKFGHIVTPYYNHNHKGNSFSNMNFLPSVGFHNILPSVTSQNFKERARRSLQDTTLPSGHQRSNIFIFKVLKLLSECSLCWYALCLHLAFSTVIIDIMRFSI